MSTTEIRDALHAVAESTTVPTLDRTALQRRVGRERRALRGYRALGGVGVAAAATLLVSVVGFPFAGGGTGGSGAPAEQASAASSSAPSSAPSSETGVPSPVPYVLGGRLHVLDPQGVDHELGIDVEEVLGATREFVYVLDRTSTVRRFDAVHGDEGPGSPWAFEEVDSLTPQDVLGARLSGDGRFLGWIDRDERLWVRDLVAGTTSTPRRLPGNSYLADVAQGSGAGLVSQDGELVLLTADGDVSVPTVGDGYGWASSAGGSQVAVVDRDGSTRVYDVATGVARLVDEVRGAGELAPYGGLVASVAPAAAGTTRVTLSRVPGGGSQVLVVPGRAVDAAWLDERYVLVLADDPGAGTSTLHLCPVDASSSCSVLPVQGEDVDLPG